MRRVDKRLFRVLLFIIPFAVIFGFGLGSYAADYDDAEERQYTNESTGYDAILIDGADLLTDEEENQLMEKLADVTEYGNAMYVTTNTPSRSTDKEAAYIYASRYGGMSGVIYLVDMGHRELYIYTDDNGYVGKVLTVAYCNTIADNTYSSASKGNFYLNADQTFSQILTLLDGGKISQPMKHISNVLMALVLSLLIVYIIASRS